MGLVQIDDLAVALVEDQQVHGTAVGGVGVSTVRCALGGVASRADQAHPSLPCPGDQRLVHQIEAAPQVARPHRQRDAVLLAQPGGLSDVAIG